MFHRVGPLFRTSRSTGGDPFPKPNAPDLKRHPVTMAGNKQNMAVWQKWMKNVDLDETTFFYCMDVLNVNANQTKLLLNNTKKCLNHVFLLEQLKKYLDGQNLTQRRLRGLTTWKDMLKNAFERYCELANKKTEQLFKVSSPCLGDHQFKEELESVGELSKACSQIVLKCLYLERIGRPDISWKVHKLAGSVTKWTHSYDRR